MLKRPINEKELQKQEAIGVIRASRFIRKYANSHKTISMETVCEIHNEIFKNAWAEIAGKYRNENLEITDSKHLPPHYSKVSELINKANQEFKERQNKLKKVEGILFARDESVDDIIQSIDGVIECASWIHRYTTLLHIFTHLEKETAEQLDL